MKVIRIIRKPEDIFIPKGMTRDIKFGVAHTTAGPQKQSTSEIIKYWINKNGWRTPGYHFLISHDGLVEQLVEISNVSNGVAGFNSNSIHFCFKGGVDSKGNPIDNRTELQKAAMLMIVKRLKQLFPNIIFLGHRDFSTDLNGNGIIEQWEWIKSCPSHDFREWLSSIKQDSLITPSRIVYKLNSPLIKNDTVKAIQMALEIEADGVFGSNTHNAIMKFQAANRSVSGTPDGIVGEATGKLLATKLANRLKNQPVKDDYYVKLLLQIKNR